MEDVVMTMTYRSLLLSYFNIDIISYQGVLLSTVIVEPSHVVTLTHFTIQNGVTALKAASIEGHHKVIELLLRAGANPDLQVKVRTGQDSAWCACRLDYWIMVHPASGKTRNNIVKFPPITCTLICHLTDTLAPIGKTLFVPCF